jgi:hypothetical protein
LTVFCSFPLQVDGCGEKFGSEEEAADHKNEKHAADVQ